MQVAADHADPGEAVSGVGVRFVQGHHVGQVCKLGVVFFQADLKHRTIKCITHPPVVFGLACTQNRHGLSVNPYKGKITHLSYSLSDIFAEQSGGVKLLDQVREQTQNIQGETCQGKMRVNPGANVLMVTNTWVKAKH